MSDLDNNPEWKAYKRRETIDGIFKLIVIAALLIAVLTIFFAGFKRLLFSELVLRANDFAQSCMSVVGDSDKCVLLWEVLKAA